MGAILTHGNGLSSAPIKRKISAMDSVLNSQLSTSHGFVSAVQDLTASGTST
ncbi:MAG: hypothetical protein JNK73_12975 [Bacteroidia bacterium]|nr:hypothetical protein [Bacteroidia bacterium]